MPGEGRAWRPQPRELEPSLDPSDAELPGVTHDLERRIVAVLLTLLGAIVFAYGWIQPTLGGASERLGAYLVLAGVLGVVSAAGLIGLRPALEAVRQAFLQRDARLRRLVHKAEHRARRLDDYSTRLEQRNAELQQISYVVAHDLRELARTVSTHARLVQRNAADRLDGQPSEDLEQAVQAAKRLDRMLADVLTYATLDQQARDPEPVELEDVVSDALDRLAARRGTDEARIEVEELPRAHGDPSQLVVLFENLIDNAVKFGPEDETTRVEVRARQVDGCCVVEVEDNGVGMEPQYAERVFSMFERLHDWSDTEGTGVGLTICQRIVERHGGDIEVDAEPDEGCTFRFTLPEARPDDPDGPPEIEGAQDRFRELV